MVTSRTRKNVQKAKPAKAAARPRKPVKAPAAPVVKVIARNAPPTDKAAKGPRFSSKDLAAFRRELLIQRDRLTGQVANMRKDSLKRDDEVNPEEDGTNAFDRLFTLEQAGTGQNRIFVIDEALRAIDEGHYGQCEVCGNLIEKPRLQALPFAKNCIKCQSELERGHSDGPHRLVL